MFPISSSDIIIVRPRIVEKNCVFVRKRSRPVNLGNHSKPLTKFGHKMAHKLKWYSHDDKTGNFIDHLFVNRRLAGSIQGTRVHRSVVIDV